MFQWLTIAFVAIAASFAFVGADRVLESLQGDGEDEPAQTSQTTPPAEPQSDDRPPSVVSFFNRLFGSEAETPDGAASSTANAPVPATSQALVETTGTVTDPTIAQVAQPEDGLYGPPAPGTPAAQPLTVTETTVSSQPAPAPSATPTPASATGAGVPAAAPQGTAANTTATEASESDTPIPALW